MQVGALTQSSSAAASQPISMRYTCSAAIGPATTIQGNAAACNLFQEIRQLMHRLELALNCCVLAVLKMDLLVKQSNTMSTLPFFCSPPGGPVDASKFASAAAPDLGLPHHSMQQNAPVWNEVVDAGALTASHFLSRGVLLSANPSSSSTRIQAKIL